MARSALIDRRSRWIPRQRRNFQIYRRESIEPSNLLRARHGRFVQRNLRIELPSFSLAYVGRSISKRSRPRRARRMRNVTIGNRVAVTSELRIVINRPSLLAESCPAVVLAQP